MAKSGYIQKPSQLVVDEDALLPQPVIEVDSESNLLYNNTEELVSLRSVYDGRLVYTGQETGKRYEWDRAGSIVSVSAKDADYLLSKRFGGNPCCGGSTGRHLFEKV